jgi:hypothetical protein
LPLPPSYKVGRPRLFLLLPIIVDFPMNY